MSFQPKTASSPYAPKHSSKTVPREGRLLLAAHVVWTSIPRIWRTRETLTVYGTFGRPGEACVPECGKEGQSSGLWCRLTAVGSSRVPASYNLVFKKLRACPNFPLDYFFLQGNNNFFTLLHGIGTSGSQGLSKHLLIDFLIESSLCIEGQHWRDGAVDLASHPVSSQSSGDHSWGARA